MITEKWSKKDCEQSSTQLVRVAYLPYLTIGDVFIGNESLWLLILAILPVVFFGWLFLKLQDRQRQDSRVENEIEVRILQQQKLISELQLHNDQLKISKENLYLSIAEKDRFIAILIHDLRSPLRFLYSNTAYLFRNWKRDSHTELDLLITEINNSTKQIHFLTEEMMQWISTQDHTYDISIKEYLLLEIVNELAALFKETIFYHGNTLELIIPDRMKINTDRVLLKTILRNLIDNANKNTEDGLIRVQARQSYEKIVITVSDSGVGVSPLLLQEINQYFNTSGSVLSFNTQFGHEIIRDFARLLNATVVYETPESGGLSVSLTIQH